jgi:hypothetical protein
MKLSRNDEHKLLALWAADCAERVLYVFENENPEDDRPCKAIEAARLWAQGKIKVSEARKFAFASHAAAREVKSPGAIAAARAAGHAAATAHVPGHAIHAAAYAVKASQNKEAEREWQMNQVPEKIRRII